MLNFLQTTGKRKRTPLLTCETKDAGRLREAAERKKDENILREIRDQDCVAIEVKYHKSCYQKYTSFLKREIKNTKSKYDKPFEAFCKEIIDEKLIKNKEIWYTKDLRKEFIRVAKETDNIDASCFKTFSLKQRLIRSHPQLVFYTPAIRNVSEMVYVENLCPEDIVEEHMMMKSVDASDGEEGDDDESGSESEESGDDNIHGGVAPDQECSVNELQILYNAASIVRNKLQNTPDLKFPWLP